MKTVEERRDHVLGSTAEPPPLPPNVRKTSFLDYASLPNKSNYERLADQLLLTNDLDVLSAKDYFQVQVCLRERRRIAALADDLPQLKKLDKLLNEISNFFTEEKLYKTKAERSLISENQSEAINQKFYSTTDKWANKIGSMKRSKEKADQKHVNEGEEKLEAFDKKIPDKLPAPFRKYSSKYLDLGDQKRHAIVSKDIESAELIKKQMAQMLPKEHQRMKETYLASIERKRQRIEDRTEKKRWATSGNWQRKIDEEDSKKHNEIEPIEASRGHLYLKTLARKSEYTGEEDLIVHTTNTRGLTTTRARSLKKEIQRPVYARPVPQTGEQKSVVLYKASRILDSKRWPR